jgi:hypothetical protein
VVLQQQAELFASIQNQIYPHNSFTKRGNYFEYISNMEYGVMLKSDILNHVRRTLPPQIDKNSTSKIKKHACSALRTAAATNLNLTRWCIFKLLKDTISTVEFIVPCVILRGNITAATQTFCDISYTPRNKDQRGLPEDGPYGLKHVGASVQMF